MAKFSPPWIPRAHSRERLFQQLDAVLESTAVWISGGAGAGKTTLIASHLEHRRRSVLWCQVDAGDADAAVCCHSLLRSAGLTAATSTLGFPPLDSLQRDDLEAFFRRFFADYYLRLPAAVTLVLDNAQEALTSNTFRTLLRFSISEAPRGLHLIIASRVRPPPEFARFLVSGSVVPLDPHKLPFTQEESFEVQRLACLERPLSERLTLQQMRTLHQLSRGWPAGLKLLLQLSDADLSSLERGDLADQTALFDYLAGEIFERQTPHIRHLLLQLAHLPRMGVAMAQALCATPEAEQVLAAMAQDGLLTSVHGSGAETQYEFHPLLRRFLVQKARSELAVAPLGRLRRRAAHLLANGGDLNAAAQLLISGMHWNALQRLVLGHAATLVGRGWQRTLAGWLSALPQARRAEDPWLCYWWGESQLHFDPPTAQASFERAYRLFRTQHSATGAWRAWCSSVDLICLEWADFSQLDYWLDEAPSLHAAFGDPDDELLPRLTASMFGGLLFRRPDDPAIHGWAERLMGLIEASPDPNQRILLGCNLQIHHTVCVGRKAQLDRLMKAVQPRDEAELAPVFAVLWEALKAMHAWSDACAEDAAAAATRGFQLARENGLRMWDFFLGALDVYAWLNDGDLTRAHQALQRLEAYSDARRKVDVAHFHFLTALCELFSQRHEAALAAIDQSEAIAIPHGGPHQHALASLTRAEILHALGRTEEAWPLLERVRAMGHAHQSEMIDYQVALSEAWLAWGTGKADRCAAALAHAFAIGEQQGYLNHQYFRPAVMSQLCAFALERGIVPGFARRLIRCRRLQPPPDPPEAWPWPIRIRTLGRFGLSVDDRQVMNAARSQAKPIALLQVLIALGGRDVPIAEVVKALWGEEKRGRPADAPALPSQGTTEDSDRHVETSAGGRGVLDINLSRLRRLLGHDDALLVGQRCLTLNPERCWVDLWHCQRLLQETRRLLDDDSRRADVARLVSHSRQLLGQYAGDFLAGNQDAPWARACHQKLRSQLVGVLAELAAALCKAKALDQAVNLYERAIDLEPVSEALYRGWMDCLQQQGEVAEALRVYHRCRTTLAEALGVGPSRKTEALHARLRDRSPPAQGDR